MQPKMAQSEELPQVGTGTTQKKFMASLYDLLSSTDSTIRKIISWTSDGLSVAIFDEEAFHKTVEPSYFPGHKHKVSFRSALCAYGFNRQKDGVPLVFGHPKIRRGSSRAEFHALSRSQSSKDRRRAAAAKTTGRYPTREAVALGGAQDFGDESSMDGDSNAAAVDGGGPAYPAADVSLPVVLESITPTDFSPSIPLPERFMQRIFTMATDPANREIIRVDPSGSVGLLDLSRFRQLFIEKAGDASGVFEQFEEHGCKGGAGRYPGLTGMPPIFMTYRHPAFKLDFPGDKLEYDSEVWLQEVDATVPPSLGSGSDSTKPESILTSKSSTESRRSNTKTFMGKLHDALSSSDPAIRDILYWSPNGVSIVVSDEDAFHETVGPRFFPAQKSKYTFQFSMRDYGFRRRKLDNGKVSFSHPKLRRGASRAAFHSISYVGEKPKRCRPKWGKIYPTAPVAVVSHKDAKSSSKRLQDEELKDKTRIHEEACSFQALQTSVVAAPVEQLPAPAYPSPPTPGPPAPLSEHFMPRIYAIAANPANQTTIRVDPSGSVALIDPTQFRQLVSEEFGDPRGVYDEFEKHGFEVGAGKYRTSRIFGHGWTPPFMTLKHPAFAADFPEQERATLTLESAMQLAKARNVPKPKPKPRLVEPPVAVGEEREDKDTNSGSDMDISEAEGEIVVKTEV
ncbi:HSF-DOMAIN domain-containing protein [Mycena chlorophos]|uniref:HSF-DOMAIN domain-containing protein n=1 Tax=Mycena chlorophos TaxID=658473 RepID=A0A8H6SDQ9_MYCCL|nr:HSF-DOMAIN domain-containing protein [Mycena chlorophos]